jgi:lysophospholipase L1-like esterase
MRGSGLNGQGSGRLFSLMTRQRLVVTVCLLLLVLVGAALRGLAQDHPFYLHKDDRVVFYGDSITEQGRYVAFVEAYVVTRFPDLNVRFINSGWAGDWVVGGGGGKIDERLTRDVVGNKPTVATFMLGMNDAAYQDFDTTFLDVYAKGYRHVLDTLRRALPDLRITLFEPSPFDDITRPPKYALHDGGYNKVIVRYGQFVQELARQQNVEVIDMNGPLVTVLEKAHLADPVLAQEIIPDRIHPSAAGGLVMASAILKAWNAPAAVSMVEIDASHTRVQRQANTRITELRWRPDLSWTQEDSALPMPFDPDDDAIALVLGSSNILESLDRQILRVTGLQAPRYTLKIDGEEISSWTREDLAQGVNLAQLATPMLRQALIVYAFSGRLHSIRLARWQGVQVALQDQASPHITEALAALDALADELVEQQKAAAAPKPHHYDLLPQNN